MMNLIRTRRADTNVSDPERWVSMAGGAGLVAYGIGRRDVRGAALALVGGFLVQRGWSGHCDLYQSFGINTASRGYEKGTGSRAGAPYELGIRVDHEVRIARPAADLYAFWRNLENLPRFMRHIECVKVVNDRLSHWVATGPAGMKAEWNAEVVNEIENRLIGWRSLEGSRVDNGGSVRFEPVNENETVVRVSLQYNPPAGSVGAMVARWFGEDPQKTVREDLMRFKEIMETGRLSPQTQASAEGERWRSQPTRGVDHSSEMSFPASDPPSYSPQMI